MKHPDECTLALYSSGDLAVLERWRIGRHVSVCRECAADVDSFRAVSEVVSRESAQIPADMHWGKLAAEMKANIHLGLEAGQIAGPAPEHAEIFAWAAWRPAAAVASLAILLTGGWWLNRPLPGPLPVALTSREVVLKATHSGIELEQNGHALALMHGDAPAALTVSMQGSLRARYLDAETGEVTIHHVYTQ